MRSRRDLALVAALLVVAILFGGGGSGAGLSNLVVQLTALLVLAISLPACCDFVVGAPRPLVILMAGSLLLPLLQSFPLPPAIWHGLPGRDLAVQSLRLVGRENEWFSMSVLPSRTLIAFLSLLPPCAVLILSWRLPIEHKERLLYLVVGAGLFVVLLGIPQLASGNRALELFDEAVGTPDLHGVFANRNTTGVFLDIALCALVALVPQRSATLRFAPIVGIVALALVVGVVLTNSRSSIVLMLMPVAFAVFRTLKRSGNLLGSGRTLALLLGGLAVMGLGGAFLMSDNARVQHSLMRFHDLDGHRPDIWADTLVSLKRFWPVGSGIGTFDEVFQVDEALESLGPGRAARAHNDYLEVLLESGVVGLFLTLCWSVWLALQMLRASRGPSTVQVGAVVTGIIAFQSILDYPLRNQTLLCIAALMVALLISGFNQESGRVHLRGGMARASD